MALTQIQDGMIAGIAASKLTGQVPDANAPSGSVIQIVNYTTSSQVSTSSSSTWSDTGLTALITPISTSSKILIICSLGDVGATGGSNGTSTRILRNGSQIGAQTSNQWCYMGVSGHGINSGSITYLDSPSSTSSITYKIQFKGQSGSNLWEVMRDNTQGSITLMEIAA